MFKKLFLMAAFSFTAVALKAQAPVQVSECYISTGVFSQDGLYTQFNDLSAFAPGSLLLGNLAKDISRFSVSQSDAGTGSTWSANIGMRFYNKEDEGYRKNPLLRLGIQFQQAPVFSQHYSATKRVPYDTITSSQTGTQTYIDSIFIDNYHISYSQKRVMLDASLIFRTKPEARWHIFGGVGMQLGMAFRSNTLVEYNTLKGTSSGKTTLFNIDNWQMLSFESKNSKTEKVANASSVAGGIYIPLGISFRLSKKHYLFKMTSLFFESRPGLYWSGVPELNTTTFNTGLSSQFGVRVNW
jgi:hypothetical protein